MLLSAFSSPCSGPGLSPASSSDPVHLVTLPCPPTGCCRAVYGCDVPTVGLLGPPAPCSISGTCQPVQHIKHPQVVSP